MAVLPVWSNPQSGPDELARDWLLSMQLVLNRHVMELMLHESAQEECGRDEMAARLQRSRPRKYDESYAEFSKHVADRIKADTAGHSEAWAAAELASVKLGALRYFEGLRVGRGATHPPGPDDNWCMIFTNIATKLIDRHHGDN